MQRRYVIGGTLIAIAGLIGVLVAAKPHKIWTVSNEVVIDSPAATVFDYATTASNWPKWHPASLNVSSVRGDVTRSGEVGDRIWESFHIGGRKSEIIWTVTQKQRPRLWQFQGKVDAGKAVGTITYSLKPAKGGGTLYKRTLTSEINSRILNLLYAFYLSENLQERLGQGPAPSEENG